MAFSSEVSTRQIPAPGSERVARRLGRPRSFDKGLALAAALGVFLTRGYASTSITELTSAMGIGRPSFYAAFGNKESLFRQALELHAGQQLAMIDELLAEATARGVAERLLRGAMADPMPGFGLGGFTGMLSQLPVDPIFQPVRDAIQAHRVLVAGALAKRFTEVHGQCEGSRPPPSNTTLFLLEALIHGVAASSLAGMPAGDCHALVQESLAILEQRGIVGSSL